MATPFLMQEIIAVRRYAKFVLAKDSYVNLHRIHNLGRISSIFGGVNKTLYNQRVKKPNTIPVFGLGKWLLGESLALKVGIYAS